MKKRVLAGAAALILALSLCACGNKNPADDGEPTVESLAAKLAAVGDEGYLSAAMSVHMTLQEEGVAMGVDMSADIESDGHISHMSDIGVNMAGDGFSVDLTMETWYNEETGETYQNGVFMDEETGWTKSIMESGDAGVNIMADALGELVDVTTARMDQNSAGEYLLTWTASPESMATFLTASVGNYADGVPMGDAAVQAVFDRATQEPVSMTMTSTYLDENNSGCSISFIMEFAETNGDKVLAIPEDIIKNAVEEGYNFTDDMEVSHNGKLYSDGEGSDPVIDALAAYLADNDEGCEYVYLWHYDGSASLDWSTYGDDWYGAAAVDHAGPNYVSELESAYADRLAQIEEQYGAPREKTETSAVYISSDYNTVSVRCVTLDDGYYYEYAIAMLDVSGTEEQALERLETMKAMTDISPYV